MTTSLRLFNIDEHCTVVSCHQRHIEYYKLPEGVLLNAAKQNLVHNVPDNYFVSEEIPSDKWMIGVTTETRLHVITEDLFNKLKHLDSHLIKLKMMELELVTREKNLKRVKASLKHINELSKNVNQLFKGLENNDE